MGTTEKVSFLIHMTEVERPVSCYVIRDFSTSLEMTIQGLFQ